MTFFMVACKIELSFSQDVRSYVDVGMDKYEELTWIEFHSFLNPYPYSALCVSVYKY